MIGHISKTHTHTCTSTYTHTHTHTHTHYIVLTGFGGYMWWISSPTMLYSMWIIQIAEQQIQFG